MLCIGIFGVHNRWCAATLVNYILVAIFLWCTVSSVRCIFGVMYMHFWYAMHRHLWWCLVGAITIVQRIFGTLFLGLGCNTFLVLCLWFYALSAISRRPATAVAQLLYFEKSNRSGHYFEKSRRSGHYLEEIHSCQENARWLSRATDILFQLFPTYIPHILAAIILLNSIFSFHIIMFQLAN